MEREPVVTASLPWKSIDAIEEIWEEVGLPVLTSRDMKCFLCDLPECVNCIEHGGKPGRIGRPRKSSYVLEGQVGLFSTAEAESPL